LSKQRGGGPIKARNCDNKQGEKGPLRRQDTLSKENQAQGTQSEWRRDEKKILGIFLHRNPKRGGPYRAVVFHGGTQLERAAKETGRSKE